MPPRASRDDDAAGTIETLKPIDRDLVFAAKSALEFAADAAEYARNKPALRIRCGSHGDTQSVGDIATVSTTSIWTILLPVLTGGIIGIVGSFGGPFFLQKAKDTVDRKRKRAEKFEELISTLYEHRHWLNVVEGIRVFGSNASATISPFAKVQAISAVYFAELEPHIQELEKTAAAYELWMWQKENERLSRSDKRSNIDGLQDVFGPYAKEFDATIKELRNIARTEFQ